MSNTTQQAGGRFNNAFLAGRILLFVMMLLVAVKVRAAEISGTAVDATVQRWWVRE